MICQNCGKIKVMGRRKSHKRGVAGKRWKKRAPVTPRLFNVNIQMATVTENGKKTQMKLCTKCIKRFKKDGKILTSKKKKN
ncbi:50S ribosomal protein L28 [Patescibacteria group bacterium]|nr:50S ribosomal protein L28 [Patescibacteria group bacterium]MBU2036358.1 50S ribosomal protein L28 [Patescibacteria group bacterium]